MSERTYIPARGFPIDATNFQRHQQTCKACAGFNSDNPASLSVLCLDGAVLWKEENAQLDLCIARRSPPSHALQMS